MLIEVLKVVTKRQVERSADGSVIRIPGDTKPVSKEDFQKHIETIAIDGIRSFRPWNKDIDQEAYIDSDMTKLYLKGDGIRKTNPEMLICENYDDFSNRINAIRLQQDGEKKDGK